MDPVIYNSSCPMELNKNHFNFSLNIPFHRVCCFYCVSVLYILIRLQMGKESSLCRLLLSVPKFRRSVSLTEFNYLVIQLVSWLLRSNKLPYAFWIMMIIREKVLTNVYSTVPTMMQNLEYCINVPYSFRQFSKRF